MINKAKNILFIAVTAILICSSSTIPLFKPLADIDKATWLLGTWEGNSSRGNMYEKWVRVSDTEFLGKGFFLTKKDTFFFETIKLVQKEDGLYYIPRVKNENQNQPVSFAMTSITEDMMVFENPDHDFPQKISYTRIGQDSLIAVISGIKKGKEAQQAYPMKRIN